MQTKKISIRKALLCAENEYLKWIKNPRMILILVIAVYIYQTVTVPLLDAAKDMHTQINVLEPFIALGSSGTIILLLPILFLVLVSDFPRTDSNSLFYIIRIGRVNWLFGQMLFFLGAIISYVLVIAILCIFPVLYYSEVSANWSDVTLNYTSLFPEGGNKTIVRLLPKNLYMQMNIFQAVVETYAFLVLYLSFLGMILLTFSLFKRKQIGILFDVGLVCIGCAFCAIESNIMWLFPMANSVVWLHYTEFYRKEIVPIWVSFLYFCFGIFILTIISARKAKHYVYDTTLEVGI